MWVNSTEEKVMDDGRVAAYICLWADRWGKMRCVDDGKYHRDYWTWRMTITVDGVRFDNYGDGYYANRDTILKRVNELWEKI